MTDSRALSSKSFAADNPKSHLCRLVSHARFSG